MLILATFILLVIIIGLTTAKLNAKAPCDHNWIETEDHDLKCSKCLRTIRHYDDNATPQIEVKHVQERSPRQEGIKIAQPYLRDAGLHDA
jgi:hypothetical protein